MKMTRFPPQFDDPTLYEMGAGVAEFLDVFVDAGGELDEIHDRHERIKLKRRNA